jgi:hypothetical protein
MGAEMRDIDSVIKIRRAIKPDAHAVGTVVGASVDTNFANGVRLRFDFADAGAAGTAQFVVKDSADDVTFVAVSGGSTAVLAVAAENEIVLFEKTRRYVLCELVVAANAIDASAVFEIYDSKSSPNPL